jgi:hypothetical protein
MAMAIATASAMAMALSAAMARARAIMPLTDGNNVDEDGSSNSRMAFG